MQDYSLHPYIYSRTGARKTRIPENEGQHLQSIFPPYILRQKLRLGYDAGMYTYLTEFCKPKDESAGYSQIGQVLHNQWSRYWNTSATFLLQKTPMLDVKFLELTKVMPTLHVLVIRHPMASYYFGNKWMGIQWLDAWSHTLELLASGEIEWYAVVTYEALVQYNDVVVEELMEVIRSGVRRYGGDGVDVRRALEALRAQRSNRRRLELHSSESTLSYLKPKSFNIALWKACNKDQGCQAFLQQLSTDILPFFGYVDATAKDGNIKNELTTDPGPKGVTEQFAHVLFSSEGDALRKFRKQHELQEAAGTSIGDSPSVRVVSTMNELLTSSMSPLKGRRKKNQEPDSLGQ